MGGFPSISQEWGVAVPFLKDYPGFTAATAGLALASTRPELVFAPHLFRIVSAIGAGVGIWYLCRSWGVSRYGAGTATFLLMGSAIFATKLLSYRPEAAGYIFMFAVPALARRWLDTGRGVFLASAGLSLAAVGVTHGVAWTVATVLMLATALAHMVASKADVRSRLLSAGMLLAAVFGVWGVVIATFQWTPAGAEKLDTIPVVSEAGTDPTWVFASFTTESEGAPPPSIKDLSIRALDRGFIGLRPSVFWGAGSVGAFLLVGLALGGDSRSRELLTALFLFGVGVLAVAVIFAWGWDTYVPRRTGFLRILQISVFLVPLLVGYAVSRTPLLNRLVPTLVVLGLAVTVWALSIGDLTEAASHQMPDRYTLSRLRALEVEGLALSNGYTEGYLASNLGVAGALEGRAPYTNPELLEEANSALGRARSFFADPADSWFDLDGYDLLVVAKERWATGTRRIFPVDVDSLRTRSDLRVLVEDDSLLVFEVAG
jgi:hypothetical protein